MWLSVTEVGTPRNRARPPKNPTPLPLRYHAPYQAQETGKGVLWGGAFWGRFSLPPYPQNGDFVWKKPYPPTP